MITIKIVGKIREKWYHFSITDATGLSVDEIEQLSIDSKKSY